MHYAITKIIIQRAIWDSFGKANKCDRKDFQQQIWAIADAAVTEERRK